MWKEGMLWERRGVNCGWKGKRSGHKTANQCMMASHQVLLSSIWRCATESGHVRWVPFVLNGKEAHMWIAKILFKTRLTLTHPIPTLQDSENTFYSSFVQVCKKSAMNWPHFETTWGPCWLTEELRDSRRATTWANVRRTAGSVAQQACASAA